MGWWATKMTFPEEPTFSLSYNLCVFCGKEVNHSSILVRRTDGTVGPVCDKCKKMDWKTIDIAEKL